MRLRSTDKMQDIARRDHSQKETNKYLEKGRITYFFRPRVGLEEAHSIENVQRFYMLLQPTHCEGMQDIDRLIVVPKKHMPHSEAHEKVISCIDIKNFAFVWKSGPINKIKEYLDLEEYETFSKGHRVVQPVRICGFGVYAIIEKENKTYLAYILEIPEILGEVQESFQIKKQSSFLIIIKNPESITLPETAGRSWNGLPSSQKANYDGSLQKKFLGKRYAYMLSYSFIPAIPVSFLNYEGCEILLIGMTDNLSESVFSELKESKIEELGIQKELRDEILFQKLELDQTKFKSEALYGHWI